MKKFIAAGALAGMSLASSDSKHHWAVLVAGSDSYSNYRHQADVHHSYKVMVENGIPKDQIILMVQDDIANNIKNPLQGQIFNHPDGENVYDAESISYKGKDVTTQNFLAVLTGDSETATGPVLKSNKKSKVFVFYADHGAPGFVCMPNGPPLYADSIQKAIDTMKEKHMYDEMIWYIEACESGSMFPKLKAEDKVYAMTASNAKLSSWAAYCMPNDKVNDVHIGACLGDLFAVSWMEDTEANNPKKETITDQHTSVKNLVQQSPVCEFGDFNLKKEKVASFQGNNHQRSLGGKNAFVRAFEEMSDKALQLSGKTKKWLADPLMDPNVSSVDSRDAKLYYLEQQAQQNGDEEVQSELNAYLEHRLRVDNYFKQAFGDMLEQDLVEQPTDFECLRYMVNTHDKACGKFEDYSLKFVKYLVHSCETETADEIAGRAASLKSACAVPLQ